MDLSDVITDGVAKFDSSPRQKCERVDFECKYCMRGRMRGWKSNSDDTVELQIQDEAKVIPVLMLFFVFVFEVSLD